MRSYTNRRSSDRAIGKARLADNGWLQTGANLILFSPSGGGKSLLAAAISQDLVEKD